MNEESRSEILARIRSAELTNAGSRKSEAHLPDTFTIQFKRPEENEGWWTVTVPEVPGTISQGETLEEAAVMAVDALKLMVDEKDTP
jgi:predicted RNase H-like HicB family nuclease